MTAPTAIFNAPNGDGSDLTFDDENRIITYKTETMNSY